MLRYISRIVHSSQTLSLSPGGKARRGRRVDRLTRLIDSGLLGRGVRHFFLVRFPGGFIAHKKLPRYDFFLTGDYAECMAIRNLGAHKRFLFITHDSSPWVKKVVLENGKYVTGISIPPVVLL
jgi:hypothetical protein